MTQPPPDPGPPDFTKRPDAPPPNAPAPDAPTAPVYGSPPSPGYGTPPPPPQPGFGGPPPGYGAPVGPAPGGYGYPPAGYNPSADPMAKSKLVAGLLGIFLGYLGIHRFYLGFTKIGVIQIIVTILTCGIGGIWGFVEGILYLIGSGSYTTDATGRPLKE